MFVKGGMALWNDVAGDEGVARPILDQLPAQRRGKIEADRAGGIFPDMADLCLLYTSPSPRDRG